MAAQLPPDQQTFDIAVVGGGPAGYAAALAARAAGALRVLLADLAPGPGGALAAMGLAGERADGVELAQAGVDVCYRTTLLGLGDGLRLRLLGPGGPRYAIAGAVVLATGGREQTRGNLEVPGTRPAGVMTAAAALRLSAATGRCPGRRVVVAGGGRWAQVAAHMIEQAGARILAIVDRVARIEGWPRISGVLLADGARHECDLLVLATPQLAWRPAVLADATPAGVFVAGAAAHAEVDAEGATEDGAQAGRRAAGWARQSR